MRYARLSDRLSDLEPPPVDPVAEYEKILSQATEAELRKLTEILERIKGNHDLLTQEDEIFWDDIVTRYSDQEAWPR